MKIENTASKKPHEYITNSPFLWFSFIVISGAGNIWMFFNYTFGKILKSDLLFMQIPLMSAFSIGLVGILYVNMNSDENGYPKVKKKSFFKWYIPLLLLSIIAICLSNLAWLFKQV